MKTLTKALIATIILAGLILTGIYFANRNTSEPQAHPTPAPTTTTPTVTEPTDTPTTTTAPAEPQPEETTDPKPDFDTLKPGDTFDAAYAEEALEAGLAVFVPIHTGDPNVATVVKPGTLPKIVRTEIKALSGKEAPSSPEIEGLKDARASYGIVSYADMFDKWLGAVIVEAEGPDGVSKFFPTQEEAMAHAKGLMAKYGVPEKQLIVKK